MPITEAVLAVASDGFDRRRELQEFDDTKAGVKGLVDSGSKSIPAIFHHPAGSLPQGQEAVTATATATDAAVPVIDLLAAPRQELVGLVRAAAETAGFFQVVNHGVPGQAMAAVLAAVRRFNEEPAEAKRPYYTRDTTTGKVRFYSNLDLFQSPAACWRDTIFCDMAPEPPQPDELPEALRGVLIEYADAVRKHALWVFELLSESLGLAGP
uniref:Non-haem dioxygenase N-terminal domain-containing protein n=1 Tax=Triticum urartu TaxID=4572 RepID=A0A8R7P9M5_TRIUA